MVIVYLLAAVWVKSFMMLFDFVYVGERAHYQGLYLGDSHHLFLAIRICPVRAPKYEYGIQSSFMPTKRKLRIQNSDLLHNNQEDEVVAVNTKICEIIHFV